MFPGTWLGVLLVLLSQTGVAGQASPENGQETAELFASNDILEFTLEADFRQLKRDRSQESEERPARLVFLHSIGPGGQPRMIEIKIRTRGNFRLQRRNCSFPPLRLNLPKSRLSGTELDGQDKLKLVTHCRDRDSFQENLVEEFLAYRVYNMLTPLSFQVRMARITYVDTTGNDDPVTRLAFLLEDEDDLARRLEGVMLDVPAVRASDYVPMGAGRFYLFQYLIGNEDWSVTHFHNVKLLRVGSHHYPIPYDFDWSGLVNASYAAPHPAYADLIRSVRDRLYRGVCSDLIDYSALFRAFNQKREGIEALIRGESLLSEGSRKAALQYVRDFYRIINDERRAQRLIVRACVGR